MKIRTRLMLFAVIVAVLIGGVGFYGVNSLKFVNSSMETIYETNLSNIQSLAKARESYLRIQISLFKLATNQSQTVRTSIIDGDLTPSIEYIDTTLDAFSKMDLTEAESKYLEMLTERQNSLSAKVNDYLDNLNSGYTRDQLLVKYGSIESAMQGVMVICDSLIEENKNAAASEYTSSMDSQHHMVTTMIIAVAVTVLVCVVFANVTVKSVTKPIGKMEKGLSLIAEGDLTVTLQTNDKTEIGSLSRSLSKTTESLRGLIGHIQEASESISVAGDRLDDMTQKTGESSTQWLVPLMILQKGPLTLQTMLRKSFV